LKKGQEIEAVITSIDTENRRLSLSIKDLEPNAWERFITEHKPGDVVKGKIARFANFGAFVELGDNLEGLCHISELSEDRVDKPEDVVQLGQEMDFRILRIDAENKKIGLSARAVSADEHVADTKTYSTEVKGGMASLSELADFFSPAASAPAEPAAEEPAAEETAAAGESAAEPSTESPAEPGGEDAGKE
jgi:small subunit ribosomal protein S1